MLMMYRMSNTSFFIAPIYMWSLSEGLMLPYFLPHRQRGRQLGLPQGRTMEIQQDWTRCEPELVGGLVHLRELWRLAASG